MDEKQIEETLIDLIIVNYKMKEMINNMIEDMRKIDITKAMKYERQRNWYQYKTEELAKTKEIEIIDLKGKKYIDGTNAEIVNIEEINPNTELEELEIIQTIEPIIMQKGKIKRKGKIILENKEG
jgi:hypothetical protein